MNKKQSGHVLLMLLVLVFLGGFTATQLLENNLFKQEVSLQQQARESETLEQIKSSLLGFAASQGIHSQSHLGHLPCPAIGIGQAPKTICLDTPWGVLPIHSKIAINYLNPGIDPRINENQLTELKHWEYAVSAQLVQPNDMNWGRWVDYSQPSITVRVPEEDDKTHAQIAAVVARKIRPTASHHYDITPPYRLITVAELQAAMSKMQVRLLHQTLENWQRQNQGMTPHLASHENLQAIPTQENSFKAVDSACSCTCSRTRCNCSCAGEGKWQSDAACWGSSSNCKALATRNLCTSNTDQPCIFAGPANLQSLWPVSRFEPVVAVNKSCRPSRPSQCPLSTHSTPCTCDFSWPDSTRADLSRYTISLPHRP